MRYILTLLFCLCAVSSAGAASVLWQPDAASLARLHGSLDARYDRLFNRGGLRTGMTSMDVAGLALDAVAATYPQARVDDLLGALLALQDREPASRTYGNIRWYAGDSVIVDRNGIEFVTRRLALLELLYADRLGAAQRQKLEAFLDLARQGIVRHNVSVSYTNIYLMKAWNLIALGEGLGDAVLAAQGHDMLATWMAHTRQTGINEYLSPSYYDVDFESLALIRNLSRDAGNRRLADEALAWFWEDVALNWYLPASRLGGTHSRDYNRLFNHGGLDAWVARAGWTGQGGLETGDPAHGPYEVYAWASPPTEARRWLEGPYPRIVTARFGDVPEKRYVHYLDRSFSIGSADSGYNVGHDNSPLVINLGAGEDVPVIDFFMDGRHDYYGQKKTLEAASGHMKALHLRPFLSSVQHDNAVLFVASVQDAGADQEALESVVTLPADAEYWVDDHHLELSSGYSRWKQDPGPNGGSTLIAIRQEQGHDVVQVTDNDDKLGVGVSRLFTTTPGATYRLRASLQGGAIFLYVNFLDANRRLIGGEHAVRVSGAGSGYVWREQTVQAPAGAAWAKAWVYSTTGNRTEVSMNDLRFEELAGDGSVAQLLGRYDFHAYLPQQVSIPAEATLFVRRGGAVAALRLLGAWDVSGKPTGWTLFNDGLDYGALRLTATHAAKRSEARASIAMWAMAAGDLAGDAGFAAFRRRVGAMRGHSQLDGGVLDAFMDGPHPLHVRADVEKGKRLLREGQTPVHEDAAREVLLPYAD